MKHITSLNGYDKHEKVIEINDKKNNLKGFIAIHNTNLGPAVGGTRMFMYKDATSALKDVLNLSRAMTYKCAISGINFGGGKAVLIGNPLNKDNKFLASYAKKVKSLNGQFFTGEDMGISESDVQYMLKFCPFFIGKSEMAGDPSPFASLSVYLCMKTAVNHVYGSDSLNGKSVAIRGVGKVGSELVRLLYKEGAQIYISDVNKQAEKDIKNLFPEVVIVKNEEIPYKKIDIYSPCAFGGEFNLDNIQNLRCRIICGGANNQLSEKKVGEIISKNKILYVPDYVANAGGLINVSDELEKSGYKRTRVEKRIKALQKTLSKIIAQSEKSQLPTNYVSDILAEEIFQNRRTGANL